MESPKYAELHGELTAVVQHLEQLTRQRKDMEAGREEQILGNQIAEINEHRLPLLRERIHAASNSIRGKEKRRFSKLLDRIDMALNGVGIFTEIDISDDRLNALERQATATKSHRDGKTIALQIREIRDAKAAMAEQKRSVQSGNFDWQKLDAEIRRLDDELYGHLGQKPADDLDA